MPKNHNTTDCPLSALALPSAIVERLAQQDVTTISGWVRLGRRRLAIFGITRRVAQQIDVLAQKGAP